MSEEQQNPKWTRELTEAEKELEANYQEELRARKQHAAQMLSAAVREAGGDLFEVTVTTAYDSPVLRDAVAAVLPSLICQPEDPLRELRVRTPAFDVGALIDQVRHIVETFAAKMTGGEPPPDPAKPEAPAPSPAPGKAD